LSQKKPNRNYGRNILKLNNLEIKTYTVNDLTPELLEFIRYTGEREFGNDSLIYAKPGWYIFGYLNGKPVARVGMLQRTITINNKPLLIAGIGFLITEPENRNRGFAGRVMKDAVAFVKKEFKLPFGLLTCKPRLETLYNKMGWITVDESNVYVQPTGNRSCGGLIMVNECAGVSWPSGKIDLCGLPW